MGKLAALTFAREGANLAICTSAKMKELNEVAEEARELGVKVVAEQCDITNEESVSVFVKKIRDGLGRADVVINTAGYRSDDGLMKTPIEEWNRSIAVNIT